MISRLKSVLSNLNEEKGSVFPLVLILLLLGGLMLPALLSYMETGIVSGTLYDKKSEELYAADAGAMDALWLLTDNTPSEVKAMMLSDGDGDPDIYTYLLLDNVNGKTVQYTIEIDGSVYIITSTATSPDGSRTIIEVRATPRATKNPPLYAAASLHGGLKINADLGSLTTPKSNTPDGDDVGTGDDMTKVFNLAYRQIEEFSEEVYVDDVLQVPREEEGDVVNEVYDYTIDYVNGQLAFVEAPVDGAEIWATYVYTPGWVNIYAYGLTDIYGSAQVYGDAHYYDHATGIYGKDYGVVPDAYDDPDNLLLYGEPILEPDPLFITEKITDPADIGGQFVEGDLKINSDRELGNENGIHITGDLTIGSNALVTLKGTVWVEGTIDIGGGCIVTDDIVDEDAKPYWMISEYSGANAIYLNGNAPAGWSYKVHAAMYAPSENATISISGDGALEGSAVAWGDVKIVGSSTLYNYVPLSNEPIWLLGCDILAWKIY